MPQLKNKLEKRENTTQLFNDSNSTERERETQLENC